jgi:hypothetical protein
MVRGEGVPELVQEIVHTVRPLGALVVALGHALSAVESRAFCHALDDHISGQHLMATVVVGLFLALGLLVASIV